MADNLKFKQGLYKNISNLSNGDVGFAQFDANNTEGTLVLKSNNKILNLMPTPGTSATVNMPLVSTGANTSPEYKTLPVAGGGTGATTAAGALKNLGLTATAKELNYTDGVTSNIQTQLNNITGTLASTSINGLMSKEDKIKLDNTNIVYGTCSTEASTSKKVIIVSETNGWTLKQGSLIAVYFDYTNSASDVSFCINSADNDAYPLWYNNAEYSSTSSAIAGYAKRTILYMFNGSHFVWIAGGYDANSTYSNVSLGQGYGTCSTAAATVAKIASLSGYELKVGGIVSIKFSYAVPSNATLNINSAGAKSIYYQGKAIAANVIKAGDIATFIYSTQYHLISIDRWQEDIEGKVSLIGNETIAGIKTFRSKSIGASSLAKASSNNGSITSATNKLYHIININSTSPWMIAFTVRMYQSYRYTDIVISGYNYASTKTWHSPTATILGTSTTTNEDIVFGNYSDNLLWVAIPAGNYYGVDIIDVTSGLNDQISDYSTLFTIEEGTLPTSALESKTITAYAPWYRDETVTNATNATKLTTNAGSTYAPIYFTGGVPKQCTSPSMIINLSSNNASSIFLQSPKPGVTGILSVANGGTGANSPEASRANLGAASITFITWGEDDTYATIGE